MTPLAEAPRYAYDLVARICREVGPGLPGTPQERRRGAVLEEELETHLGRENVTVEEFSFAPGAFLGSVQIGAILTLAAASASVATGRIVAVSPWVTVAIAVLCSASAALVVTFEFLGSVELLDRFFPKRRSANVVGTLRRPGEHGIERLLLVSGHHDSAPENTWFRLLGYGGLVTSGTMFLGFAAMLGLALVQLVALAAGHVPSVGTLGTILLVWPIGASIVIGLTFARGKRGGGVVPGAVDNLAASAVTVALCRHLVRNPELVPPGTEIRFVSFGAEEAGVRGSRRYVARHRAELVRLGARILNLEMIADPCIRILTSDLNRTVQSAPAMVQSVVAAARAAGVPYDVVPAGLGVATDAGPFLRAGIDAVTLIPFEMPRQLVELYHQRSDTPERLTIAPIANVLALAVAWIGAAAATRVSSGATRADASG